LDSAEGIAPTRAAGIPTFPLIDALLDDGADLERGGSSIDGGPPLSSAVGYGQWAGARRLAGRGAKTRLWQEALGMMEAIAHRIEATLSLRTQLSGPFWNDCHGGQLRRRAISLRHGADLNWSAPCVRLELLPKRCLVHGRLCV